MVRGAHLIQERARGDAQRAEHRPCLQRLGQILSTTLRGKEKDSQHRTWYSPRSQGGAPRPKRKKSNNQNWEENEGLAEGLWMTERFTNSTAHPK